MPPNLLDLRHRRSRWINIATVGDLQISAAAATRLPTRRHHSGTRRLSRGIVLSSLRVWAPYRLS